MGTQLELREAGKYQGLRLTHDQARWLSDCRIARVLPGWLPGTYDLEVGQRVGVAAAHGLQVSIEPKVQTRSIVSMLEYSLLRRPWQTTPATLDSADLTTALANLFAAVTQEATESGLLQGYWVTEESSPTFRGRIRLMDQLNRHYLLPVPLETTHDEFGPNIPENQILLAALSSAP